MEKPHPYHICEAMALLKTMYINSLDHPESSTEQRNRAKILELMEQLVSKLIAADEDGAASA